MSNKRVWSDLEHDFLAEGIEAGIPCAWVERAVDRPRRSGASHAQATGLPTPQLGRPTYNRARELRSVFNRLVKKYEELGLEMTAT
jgi:hypothetical protein